MEMIDRFQDINILSFSTLKVENTVITYFIQLSRYCKDIGVLNECSISRGECQVGKYAYRQICFD